MPKKRVLPYVLLGLINNKETMSGYQISQEFETEIGEFWHASHSQIYPELQRMRNDHWLEVLDSDANATYYRLTATGQKKLRAWLEEDNTDEEIFSLKLYFTKQADDPLLEKLIEKQLRINVDKLTELKQRLTMIFPDESDIRTNYGHNLILTRAIKHEQNYIRWL